MDRKARHNCWRDMFRLTAALTIMLGLGGWTAAQAGTVGPGSQPGTTSFWATAGSGGSMGAGGTSAPGGQWGQPGMGGPHWSNGGPAGSQGATAMPELPAWVLLAAGLALLGLVTRRWSAPLQSATVGGADSVTHGG